jgi:hypothetical protein
MGTALFIDSLNNVDENYQRVLQFATKAAVNLQPLSDIALVEGRYHD